MIRTVLVVLYIFLSLLFFSPILGILWFVKKSNRLLADKTAQSILRFICKGVIVIAGIDLKVYGLENVPKDSPVLFVGNHRSYFDIIITLAQNIKLYGYVAKLELGKIPLLKMWMKKINCIFLDRDDIRAGMQVILKAIENVKLGISVFIYPEGTRHHDEYVHDFKAGSFKIATKTGCPIIPVAVLGSDDIFENHVPKVIPAKVKLYYGTPILPESLNGEEKKHIAEYTKNIIEDMIKNAV